MNAEEAFDTAFDAGLDAGLFQLVADDLLHLGQEGFSFFAASVHGFFDLLVSDRIEETEA